MEKEIKVLIVSDLSREEKIVWESLGERPGTYIELKDGKYYAYEYRDGAEPQCVGEFTTQEEAMQKINSLT